MSSKKQIIVCVIVGIMFLIVGGLIGYSNGMKAGPAQTKVQTENSLSSKVISSIVAYGTVQYADTKTKTISIWNLGDNLVISVPDSARVYEFTLPAGAKTPIQESASFSNIQQNNNVNVNLKLLPNGKFEAASVIILPPLPTDTND